MGVSKGLRDVYIMNSVQELAFSLVVIFMPIYFLTIGFSIREVFIFFIINYSLVAVFSFLSIYMANYFGLQKTIIIRTPFLIVFLLLLLLSGTYNIPLWSIAFFNALQTAFYFIPLHVLFANSAKLKEMGSSMGKYFALPKLAGIIGPLLGGFTAFFLGFNYLFIIIIAIYAISVIPMLRSRAVKTKFSFDIGRGKKLFFKYPQYFFAEIFNNIGEEMEGIIWPMFIFVTFSSLLSVGYVGTLVGLGSFLFTILVGKYSDKFKKEKIIKLAALLFIFIWASRYFYDSMIFYYVITAVAGFVMMMFLIPFHSLIYSVAKRNTTDEFIVFREVPTAIGRLLLFTVALSYVDNLAAIFPVACLAYIYFLFLD